MIDLGAKWSRITAFAVAILLFVTQLSVAGHADENQDISQSDPACELCLFFSNSDDACPPVIAVDTSLDYPACYVPSPILTLIVNSNNDSYASRAPPVQLNYS